MTTLWTCDIDESEVDERCAKEATHLLTWFDEADKDAGRAGHTLKVCAEHSDDVKAGLWETPAIVDVGVARIDRAVEHQPVHRPDKWCWPHLERGEFVPADATVHLDGDGRVVDVPGEPFRFCRKCLAEYTRDI